MEYNLHKDFLYLKNLLENKTPFYFAKFNDGEISLITSPETSHASRGFQPGSKDLSDKLREAILYKGENYFVGIPCSKCFSEPHKTARELASNVTLANLLINSNMSKTMDLFKKVFPTRNIVLIASYDFDVRAFSNFMGVVPKRVITVPSKDGWRSYNLLQNMTNVVHGGDLVIGCCGPLGRVICSEMYRNNPELTCLDLGSFFDPVTIGKIYMYHRGTLPHCEECYPDIMDTDIFSDEIISKCYYRERYYPDHWDNIEKLYKYKYPIIKRVYYGRYQDEREPKDKYYSLWMSARAHRLQDPNDYKNWMKSYEKTLTVWPHRLEAVFEGINSLGDSKLIFENSLLYVDYPDVNDTDDMVDHNIYRFRMADQCVISAYYSGNHRKGYDVWKTLMKRFDNVPDSDKDRVKDNGRYSKMILDDVESYENFTEQIQDLKTEENINSDSIPNIIHFIYIHGGHPFVMSHYIAIRSASELHKPDKIFLYNDKEPENNVWWERAKKYAKVINITPPKVMNSRSVMFPAHKADIMRITILNIIGGVYFDIDVLSLKPYNELLKTDKYISMPEEKNTGLGNCAIIAKPNNPFIERWIQEYKTTYGEQEHWWHGLSVIYPGKLAKEHPEWVEVLPTKSFIPDLFLDFSIYEEGQDVSERYTDSYSVHLWDTEAFKYNKVPLDVDYYKNHNNTFTKLFRKYTIEFENL